MTNKHWLKSVTALGLGSLLLSPMAQAQLATNIGVDVRAMSMAHAVTADPPGVMSIHFNPAGLGKITGRQLDLQFLGVDLSMNTEFTAPPGYNVFGFSDDPVVCADSPLDGADFCRNFITGKSTIEGVSLYLPILDDSIDLPPGPLIAGPLPSFAIRPAGSKFTFATAAYAPMAAGLYRSDNDPGNFMGKRVALERVTYLSPSIGYQATDNLYVGASIGLSYQAVMLQTDFRAPNELTGFARIMDESICAPFKGQSNVALDLILFGICNAEEGLGPFKSLASVEVAADQTLSTSWNLGVLWEPSERFAWGAVWHSPAKNHLSGKYTVRYSQATQDTVNGIAGSATGAIGLAVLGIPAGLAAQETGALSMDLDMPAHFQTGIKFRPTEKLQFNVDAVWVDYSKWQEFKFVFDRATAVTALARLFSPGSTATSLAFPLGYESTWNLAFGAQYDLTGRIQLRAGFEPRASAIPDDKRSPMVPINKARYYSLGLGYKWDKDTDIDFALATLRSEDHIPANTSCMANCTGLGNMIYNPYAGLDIATKTTINILGLAFRTRF